MAAPTVHRRQLLSAALLGTLLGLVLAAAVPVERNGAGGRKLSQISVKSEKEDGKKSLEASFSLTDFSEQLSKVFDVSLGPLAKSFSFDTDSSGLSKSVSVSSGSSSPPPPPAKPPAAKSPAPPAAKPPAPPPPAPKPPAGGGGDGIVINIVNDKL